MEILPRRISSDGALMDWGIVRRSQAGKLVMSRTAERFSGEEGGG